MHARQKLNQVYATGAAILAAFIGVVLNSWWGFGVSLAALLGLNVLGGSIRLAPGPRAARRYAYQHAYHAAR